jgi:hypothetical protein
VGGKDIEDLRGVIFSIGGEVLVVDGLGLWANLLHRFLLFFLLSPFFFYAPPCCCFAVLSCCGLFHQCVTVEKDKLHHLILPSYTVEKATSLMFN